VSYLRARPVAHATIRAGADGRKRGGQDVRRRMLMVVAGVLATILVGAPAAVAASPALPSNDPFYTYSGSLANVAPGTVLRHRTVSVAENGSSTPITATQVLYRTTGELGQPTATVATILRPTSQVLVTKIVSYQTAYDALGSECDPSYTLQGGNPSYSTAQDEEQIILAYVAAGYTVVVPDYEGVHLDWAAGQESGYNTLDGIRAAENQLGVPQGSTPAGMVGYSGGSIATEFASELAPKYAPGLDILGTAEGGVPVDFFHNLAYINGSPDWSGVIPAVIVALSRAFNVNLDKYLSPYGLQVTNQVKGECINNFLGTYPGLTYQKLAAPQYQNIDTVAPEVTITNHLIMSRTGTPRGPLFIGVGNADGTGDGVMVAKDDEALAHTYCQRGVSVQFNVYNGDTHTNAAVPFEQGALQFLSQRLSGQAVPNGCGSIGAGNSLAPVALQHAASPKVRLQNLGRKPHLHGVEIKLYTTTGALNKLVVTFRHRGRRLERFRIARLSTRRHRLILREHHRMPPRGRYTLTVTQGGKTLLKRTLKIR
jgi:Secretory lipase